MKQKLQTQQAQQAQAQQQNQNQQQNQAQQAKIQAGGEAMIYFVTFAHKIDKEKAQRVLAELRRRFPKGLILFAPKPPAGRKRLIHIDDLPVVITFSYKQEKQEQSPTQAQEEGFKLVELLKTKKV